MKRYPRVVQCDKRGQIVIPKDIRSELHIDEGTGFWVYAVDDEGIFLKKVNAPPLDEHSASLAKVKEKSGKLGVDPRNVDKAVKRYKKTKEGNLEIL